MNFHKCTPKTNCLYALAIKITLNKIMGSQKMVSCSDMKDNDI